MTGKFFAVGRPQFIQACHLGMNPAVAFLVMARGTLADNSTTSWSALAIYKYSGVARRRGKKAIELLINEGLVEAISEASKPKYKLAKPGNHDDLVWLPNTLVDGAGKEIPPIMKLREYGNLEILEKFILLYHEQDLEADGGIPRTIARRDFRRERIGEIGPFNLFGFCPEAWTASSVGIFSECKGRGDENGCEGAWIILEPLMKMGLLDKSLYVCESSEKESELIYPVVAETQDAIEELWEWAEQVNRYDFLDKREEFEHFGIALQHIPNACLTGCLRLRYRPHTSKTSKWWASEQTNIQAMVGLIRNSCDVASGFKRAHQG